MQTLMIKNRKNPKGEPKAVVVLRSWSNAAGQAIFLHQNGIYGYKDGSPIREDKELLDLIHDPMQRRHAMNWWEQFGRDYSERYWAKYTEALDQAYSTRMAVPTTGDHAGLDMIQYQRRASKDRREQAFSDPVTWSELGYDQRPEGWGLAKALDTGEFYFRRVDLPDAQALNPEAAAEAAASTEA